MVARRNKKFVRLKNRRINISFFVRVGRTCLPFLGGWFDARGFILNEIVYVKPVYSSPYKLKSSLSQLPFLFVFPNLIFERIKKYSPHLDIVEAISVNFYRHEHVKRSEFVIKFHYTLVSCNLDIMFNFGVLIGVARGNMKLIQELFLAETKVQNAFEKGAKFSLLLRASKTFHFIFHQWNTLYPSS